MLCLPVVRPLARLKGALCECPCSLITRQRRERCNGACSSITIHPWMRVAVCSTQHVRESSVRLLGDTDPIFPFCVSVGRERERERERDRRRDLSSCYIRVLLSFPSFSLLSLSALQYFIFPSSLVTLTAQISSREALSPRHSR